MIPSKHLKQLLLALTSTAFIACGSGSSTTDKTDIEAEQTKEEVKIPNILPKANAGVDMNITFGQPIILNGAKSSDVNGTIIQYEWKNGTETVGNQANIVLDNITAEGTYTFTLTVTDDENATATDSVKVITYSDTVVVLNTNQGDIELKMFSNIAPKAVENFVTHSKNGYYDGIIFHRVIKDFMIQGGDPLGTGYGGTSIWGTPFEDETTPSVLFNKPFLLAMANSGKNTNASQFFITTKEADFLNGKYTLFGEVIEGTNTVTAIENTPVGYGDKPKEEQKIIKAYIKFEVK